MTQAQKSTPLEEPDFDRGWTKRRRIAFLGVTVALAVFFVGRELLRDREPSFQSKTLTQWLVTYLEANGGSAQSDDSAEAAAAVRHIGTNAIPWLWKWLNYEPSPWQRKLVEGCGKLPSAVRNFGKVTGLTSDIPRDFRKILAGTGFTILGADAAPMVPELKRLLNDPRTPGEMRFHAQRLLASIEEAQLKRIQTNSSWGTQSSRPMTNYSHMKIWSLS